MADRIGKRRVTRREVLVGLGAAAAAGVLARARRAAPAVVGAKTKLIYSNYEQKQTGVIAGLSNYWDLAKEAFERKYPDIEIVQVSVPSSEYWNKLFTEITTGNAADLYKDRLSEVVQFTRMGLLSPLDELCNVKDINANFEDIQKTQIVDGKTYGVAYQGGSHQLVYNKNLLAKGGFKVPTTPEEAYEAAKKLTKPGEQWGFVVVTPSVPQLYIDLTQWVVGYNSHWGDNGKVTATADATVAAMEMYKRLVTEGITPVGVPKPQTREMFVAGKIAMMIEGPWFFADPKITPERLAFMGTATLPWANKRSVSSASAFIVPKAAKNKEDDFTALALLGFLVHRNEVPEDLVKAGLESPAQPGAFAWLEQACGRRQALLIPAKAVSRSGQLESVGLVVEGGVRLRHVRTGKSRDGQVEVLSGLKEGDAVMVGGGK